MVVPVLRPHRDAADTRAGAHPTGRYNSTTTGADSSGRSSVLYGLMSSDLGPRRSFSRAKPDADEPNCPCASRNPASQGILLGMSSSPTVVLNTRAVARTISRMADEIIERNEDLDRLILVGIQRRGVQIADRIADVIREREKADIPRGALDITLYRDDLQTVGPRPVVGKTYLPSALEGKVVVIVDDVLYTGRTIRAALDELADFGRPARIMLAVLIDRGGRELPIHADIVGKTLDVRDGGRVDVFVPALDGRDEVVLFGGLA